MVSTKARSPIFWPLRRFCGVRRLAHALLAAGDDDARRRPAAICWAPSATARRPEPHSWLRLQAGLSTGMPALTEAWRAGPWPAPACSTWPRITSSTSPAATPARSSAAWMAILPSSWAGRLDERAVERADRRAGGGDDDDVAHGAPGEAPLRSGDVAPTICPKRPPRHARKRRMLDAQSPTGACCVRIRDTAAPKSSRAVAAAAGKGMPMTDSRTAGHSPPPSGW